MLGELTVAGVTLGLCPVGSCPGLSVDGEPCDDCLALFAAQGLPVPRPADFSTAVLQRTQLGHSGAQWFFSVDGRAFCLHAVLGSHSRRAPGAVKVAGLLSRTATGRRRRWWPACASTA